MTTLMKASNQWMSRPADERFTSLTALHDHCDHQRSLSRARVMESRELRAEPLSGDPEHKAIVLRGPEGNTADFTHWSFGQLARLGGAPADYVRTLPAPLAADCVNYGLQVARKVEDVGVLLQRGNGTGPTLRAVTGPKYGRVWNSDITAALCNQFGDGINGKFRVPGEFGKRVDVTKENTTLYASDRDMFVFLADEENRIEVPNRRDGESGSLARGFFVWNSEVGNTSLGICTFLFDYVCCNRIVWGAEDVKEIRIRHSSGAPAQFLRDVTPAIKAYAESSTKGITLMLTKARASRIGDAEAVADFLSQRFTRTQAEAINAAHVADEGRPIETLWDAATGITAYARGVDYQDRRIDIEREAGKVLKLAA